MDKNKALQALLAAEADYLTACGWVPISISARGKVRWVSPDKTEQLFQENAVREQKLIDRIV